MLPETGDLASFGPPTRAAVELTVEQANESRVVEPGMIFAVETPYYGNDVGAIMIEDLVLLTPDDPTSMHTSPRDLVVVVR